MKQNSGRLNDDYNQIQPVKTTDRPGHDEDDDEDVSV